MMIRRTQLLLFSSFIGFALSSYAVGEPSDPVRAQLENLVKKARDQSEPACQEAEKQSVSIDDTEFDDDVGEVYKNRELALRAYNYVITYPGFPPASLEFFKVLTQLDSRHFASQWLSDLLLKIPQACNDGNLYATLRNLILGRKRYQLTSQQIDRIRESAFKYVETTANHPETLFPKLISIALLGVMDRSGILGKPDTYRSDVERLEQEGQALKKRLKFQGHDQNKLKPSEETRLWMLDLKESESLRPKLKALFEKMKRS